MHGRKIIRLMLQEDSFVSFLEILSIKSLYLSSCRSNDFYPCYLFTFHSQFSCCSHPVESSINVSFHHKRILQIMTYSTSETTYKMLSRQFKTSRKELAVHARRHRAVPAYLKIFTKSENWVL